MKNKKGFTLIEMLIVIAVIGTIMAAIGVSVDGMNKRNIERQYKNTINQIFNAAQVYSGLPSKSTDFTTTKCKKTAKCSIQLNTLITDGLLDEKILEQINPLTNNDNFTGNNIVYVYYENYEKYIELRCDSSHYVNSKKEDNKNYYELYEDWRKC